MKVINRIKKSEDFALTINKGTSQRFTSFIVHYRNNDSEQ